MDEEWPVSISVLYKSIKWLQIKKNEFLPQTFNVIQCADNQWNHFQHKEYYVDKLLHEFMKYKINN